MKSILEKFDYNTLPVYTINVANANSPAEIGQFFTALGIGHYLYMIEHDGVIIKFGMSWMSSHYLGERVYSQIGQLHSWPQHLRRGHGAEFLHIAYAYKQQYGVELDHSKITVRIWDFTKHNFTSFDPQLELEQYEVELMRRYVDLTGTLPMGNIKYTPNILTKLLPQKEHYFKLFTEE
jgi:hypothetical protein